MKNFNDSLFNEYTNCFEEYFENYKVKKLFKRDDFKEINKKISQLKNRYPKIQKFLENSEVVDMIDEEKEAILEILDLQDELKIMELKEVFKLGLKEAFIYFQEMDMFNF